MKGTSQKNALFGDLFRTGKGTVVAGVAGAFPATARELSSEMLRLWLGAELRTMQLQQQQLNEVIQLPELKPSAPTPQPRRKDNPTDVFTLTNPLFMETAPSLPKDSEQKQAEVQPPSKPAHAQSLYGEDSPFG